MCADTDPLMYKHTPILASAHEPSVALHYAPGKAQIQGLQYIKINSASPHYRLFILHLLPTLIPTSTIPGMIVTAGLPLIHGQICL